MRGEALKVYDLKRRLGLPGRRLRAYCNVSWIEWRWDEPTSAIRAGSESTT